MGKKIRFILTCACILLPLLALCLYTRFNVIAFADGEAPYYIWNKEITNTAHEKRYDVIILGDSTANASYLPTVLSDRCLNLSLGGTTPMENYYTLKEWLAHNDPPKVCYLSFIDFHFREDEAFWTRSIYTHRYTLNEEIAMLASAVKFRETSILTMYNLDKDYLGRFFEFELNLPNRYMTAILNAGFNQRKESNLLLKDADNLRRGVYIANQGEFSPNSDVTYDSFPVEPLFDVYYREIIELCLKNNIQVRIVKLPLPDNVVFSNRYEDEFYSYYAALQEAYPEVSVDWLKQSSQYSFWDSAHMNYHGALRFSMEIKELYPEDFGEETYPDERINAINFYLDQANRVDDLLMWISGKNYTAVVCDGTGKFEAYAQSLAEDEPASFRFESKSVTPAGNGNFTGDIFAVSGKEGLPEIPATLGEGSLELVCNGEPVQVPARDDLLCVIVFDQYHGQPVCVKTFRWENDGFILS